MKQLHKKLPENNQDQRPNLEMSLDCTVILLVFKSIQGHKVCL